MFKKYCNCLFPFMADRENTRDNITTPVPYGADDILYNEDNENISINSYKKNENIISKLLDETIYHNSDIKNKYNQKDCIICLDEYIDKDKIIILPCNHVYHRECIITWLLKQDSILTCPICNKIINI